MRRKREGGLNWVDSAEKHCWYGVLEAGGVARVSKRALGACRVASTANRQALCLQSLT